MRQFSIAPRWDLEFHVHTDASNIAVGVMLAQNPTGKCDQPISYASRLLNSAERNYSTTEREALAMVYALNKYRHYLLGNKFVFYVDHMALVYLVNKPQVSGRIARWLLLFQEYDLHWYKGQHIDAEARLQVARSDKAGSAPLRRRRRASARSPCACRCGRFRRGCRKCLRCACRAPVRRCARSASPCSPDRAISVTMMASRSLRISSTCAARPHQDRAAARAPARRGPPACR